MKWQFSIKLSHLIIICWIRPEVVHHSLDVPVLQLVLALQSVDGLLHLHRVLTEAVHEGAHWLLLPHSQFRYFLLQQISNLSASVLNFMFGKPTLRWNWSSSCRSEVNARNKLMITIRFKRRDIPSIGPNNAGPVFSSLDTLKNNHFLWLHSTPLCLPTWRPRTPRSSFLTCWAPPASLLFGQSENSAQPRDWTLSLWEERAEIWFLNNTIIIRAN